MEVTAGLAESNGILLPDGRGGWLKDTCGLTAGTPGSAPGPTLGYGKTLPFYPTGLGTWKHHNHYVSPVARRRTERKRAGVEMSVPVRAAAGPHTHTHTPGPPDSDGLAKRNRIRERRIVRDIGRPTIAVDRSL